MNKKFRIFLIIVISILLLVGGFLTYKAITKTNSNESNIDSSKNNDNSVSNEIDTINVNGNIFGFDVVANVIPSDNGQDVKEIIIDTTISSDLLSSKTLKSIEISSLLISGLKITDEEDGDSFKIHIEINKEKLSEKVVDYIVGLNIFNDEFTNQIQDLLNLDYESLKNILSEKGLLTNE